jgi:hypothetical protein
MFFFISMERSPIVTWTMANPSPRDKRNFPLRIDFNCLLWFILLIRILAFLMPATPNPKGWSLKQSIKTPFFGKEDGVFVVGGV